MVVETTVRGHPAIANHQAAHYLLSRGASVLRGAKLVLRSGKLTAAIRALSPVRKRGPWHVLCDNESFLDAAPCAKAHTLKRIKLWHIPPRSPDLNPVEQVWAHLKRKLRAMDLADAVAQRPLLGKTAYKLRVRRLVRSRSFQRIAANVAMGLKKTCKEVIRKRGAAAGR